jgi:hypothetical protein
MKKNLATIGVTLLLLVCAASAASIFKLNVKIPFAFNVGDKEFPAGRYIVEGSTLPNTLVLRNQEGAVLVRTISRPEAVDESFARSKLIFNRYDNQYFLAGLQSEGVALALSPSRLEKQVAASTQGGPTLTTLGE